MLKKNCSENCNQSPRKVPVKKLKASRFSRFLNFKIDVPLNLLSSQFLEENF